MLTSDGYCLNYYKNKNQIVICKEEKTKERL